MAFYTYTGKLADLGGVPFPGAVPRLWVEADRDTMGPEGPIPARKRVEVAVGSDGTFSVTLQASADLSPATLYTLRCDWLDGAGNPLGFAEWKFTAYQGGGPIRDGGAPPTFSIWVGPPWPPVGTPGLYLDKASPNDWGII